MSFAQKIVNHFANLGESLAMSFAQKIIKNMTEPESEEIIHVHCGPKEIRRLIDVPYHYSSEQASEYIKDQMQSEHHGDLRK